MKKDQSLYYLLFVLLIMGAFAAMAQNSYGLRILGGVAAVFCGIFLVGFIAQLRNTTGRNLYTLAELASLTLLAGIFALRVFYIHFIFVEVLFVIAGTCLTILYIRKMAYRYKKAQQESSFLAVTVLLFHASIILFLISLVMMPFLPKVAQVFGVVAFITLLVFLITTVLKKEKGADGEIISPIGQVLQYKDYSFLIISLFFYFSLYVGLNRIGVLPPIYSDEFPQAYFNMVDDAAAGKESLVNGKYRHQLFKEKYDDFLKRNKISNK
jgi:hypothetical protein